MANLLKEEVLRKMPGLNYASIDLANGGHVSTLHVGVSDQELLRRQKQDRKGFVSSFTDVNMFNVCIYTFIEDNIDFIVKWLENNTADRFAEEYFLDQTVGRVVLPNGGIKETECYRVVLSKNEDRTGAAGMPFDVVSMYPVM